ncbi:MAG: lytic transglycosylase domain-containing protein [Moraxellaceae bacterium]|nr:lytic transglycosylase domain-containing protein [Pseudobdellovibrionaceae bacterium]
MRKLFILFVVIFNFTTIVACAAKEKETVLPLVQVLKVADCDYLLKKAKDEKYILSHLASLYANRICKGYTFDFKNLTDMEKRIFKAKFDELDESKKAELKDTDTIDSLKLAYKNEKSAEEKFNIFKKLRQKYRASNLRDESFRLIKKNHEEIIKLTQKQLKSKKPESIYFDIYIESTQIYAKAVWNDNKQDEALKILRATLKTIGDLKPTYNLSFLIGKIQEEQLMFESAIQNYNEAITSYKAAKEKKLAVDKTFDQAKVEWNKAWIQYKNEEPARAAASLKDIAEKTTDPSEKSRALFFLAKSYKKLGQVDEAKKALQDNIANDFFSFYALASYHELGKALPPVDTFKAATPGFAFDPQISFLSPAHKNLLIALIENEESEMIDRAALVFTQGNVEYVNLGIYLADKAQFFMPLFIGFTRLTNSDKKDIFAKHSRLLFPELHLDKVKEMSKKTNIESALIYSIMKQESGFNPDSHSHADAFGLMQVIPRLAKSLAKKYKIEAFKKTEDLYNPLVNIELGTYELKDQVAKQNGQLSFVASAYNAGPNALSRWVSREPILDMFEFIENIPYDETRSYVKIIARNMLFYQRLAAPDKELSFPVEFIKIAQ